MNFTEQGKQALLWLAQGHDVEINCVENSPVWKKLLPNDCLMHLMLDHAKFRVKPKTITRQITTPEPCRVAPPINSYCYLVHLALVELRMRVLWKASEENLMWLERGLVYLNDADAVTAGKAYAGVTE